MDGKKKIKIKFTRTTRTVLSVILAVFAAVLIVIIAAQKLGNVTINTMTNNVKSYFMSMGSGDGFPCSIEADAVKDINIYNSNLFVLLDDETTLLTSTAKEIMPKSHDYSNPAMKTRGNREIVYDLDSENFRVQNSSEIVGEYKASGRIMAAAVGKSGNFAVGTYGSDVQSVLTVYSSKGEKIYIWDFKSERIADISLSDNGKFAAVATVFSQDGKISSKLYVFNFKSDEYVSCFDYPSTVLVSVDYNDDTDIIAVGNNIRSYISNGKTRKDDVNFESDVLQYSCVNDDGVSALVRSKYGSDALSCLTVYNNRKERFTVDFDKSVKWVSCGAKYTAVLFENEVRTYNKRGKQVGSIQFTGEPIRIDIDGKKVYVLTSVSLQCYNVKGSQKAE